MPGDDSRKKKEATFSLSSSSYDRYRTGAANRYSHLIHSSSVFKKVFSFGLVEERCVLKSLFISYICTP